jgi:MSHA biogenesis protein MshQ
MHYPDVGAVNLAATATPAGGATLAANKTFVVAPAAFQISVPSSTVIAGSPFTVTATAWTVGFAGGAAKIAPNFGKETTPETVTFGGALGTPCSATAGNLITVGAGNPATGPGVGRQVLYTEAGGFNVTAQQTSNYYLSGSVARPALVTSSSQGGCGGVTAVPAYFLVAPGRPKPQYYYSSQPLDFTITAMNGLGSPTTNYDNALGYSKQVTLTVVDAPAATTPKASTAGAFWNITPTGGYTPARGDILTLPASAFSKGVATVPASGTSTYNYLFNTYPTAETEIVLRAVDAAGVSSADGPKYTQTGEKSTMIRSGRIRIGNAFGSKSGNLDLPVTFEYYTGTNWLRNTSESGTLQLGTVGIKPAGTFAAPSLVNTTNLAFNAGLSKITLKPNGGAGTAYVAVNLGGGGTPSTCLGNNQPTTATGAAMPWLRVPGVQCPGSAYGSAIALDPVARATFGVFTPETKRIIHAREVFN